MIVAPSGQATLRVTPRDPGTALLQAGPSPAHLTERGAQIVCVTPEAVAPVADKDVVIHLADWLLAGEDVRFGSTPPADATRSIVTVNGSPIPLRIVAAPRARLRLRFINGSVQRVMGVACDGGRPMIAAIDGQPSTLFAPARNAFPMAPGARYDLFLDVPSTPATEVRFMLKPALVLAGQREAERMLVIVRSEGEPLALRSPMQSLPPNPVLPAAIALEKAQRADLILQGVASAPGVTPQNWTVNGIAGGAATKPVLAVRRGDVINLGFSNASATLVPLRIVGQAVRLLHAKDDGWEPYWRDCLLLLPGGRAQVAFVADVPGRWPVISGFDDMTLAGLSCFFTVLPR